MSQPYKAQVKNGRLVIEDLSSDLPEGTHVELYPVVESEDSLNEEGRQKLEAFLAKSIESITQGNSLNHEDLMKRLAKLS